MTPTRRIATALVALATTATALALPPVAAQAAAAEPAAVSTASGLLVHDIDGTVIQAPTASAAWASGAEVAQTSAATTTPSSLRSGYVITTTGTRTVAGATGARTEVDEARVELRGRVALTLRGLTVGCAPGGRSFVTVEQLLVGDLDRTAAAQEVAGTVIPLPATAGAYDDDATVTIEGSATSATGRTVTALRIANGDNYEVRDLSLGQVTCSDAPQPAAGAHRVAGVQVVDADGVRLVEPAPVISVPGAATATAAEVRALGARTRATGVTATTAADGSAHVAVDAFAQLPAEDAFAEFRASALRVNHLHLHVTPAGASSVTFDDPTNALFADGRWLNHQDGYIYSKVDDAGEVLLEVRVNERVAHGDGTTTINALHYLDHTGTWPEVVLGQVVVGADDAPGPGPTPEPQPDQPVVTPGTWHAYGVRATGSVALEAAGLVTLASAREATVADVGDSTGQVHATDVRTSISATGASSAVGTIDLFPGTDAAVRLTDLRTVASATGTVVTTGGGTVLGQPVAAGTVAPGTTYRLAGTSTTVVLGATATDGAGLPVTHGLLLSSPDELATTVIAASVTTGRIAGNATSITATPTQARTPFGDRVALRIRVAGAAAGTVSVEERGRVLTTGEVRNRTTTVRLPRRLATGRHSLVVAFSPTGASRASRSTVLVRVVRARPGLRVASTGARLAVRVTGLPVRPRGLVLAAYDDRGRQVATKRVAGPTTRLVLRPVPRGSTRVRVVLAATRDTTAASTTVRVRTR